jgi:hypothetical protein
VVVRLIGEFDLLCGLGEKWSEEKKKNDVLHGWILAGRCIWPRIRSAYTMSGHRAFQIFPERLRPRGFMFPPELLCRDAKVCSGFVTQIDLLQIRG